MFSFFYTDLPQLLRGHFKRKQGKRFQRKPDQEGNLDGR